MALTPLQQQGHDALVREFRAYEQSAAWDGCLQCLAEQRLARLASPQAMRRAGLRAAYLSGQILACRQFLAVPHSCDHDRMDDFLAGLSVPRRDRMPD
ncbi:MAG: hypothetical protein JO250_23380 [Armatimonadetes bacterium]|nr:hypothetical protein [Armatimonadota bacterium]